MHTRPTGGSSRRLRTSVRAFEKRRARSGFGVPSPTNCINGRGCALSSRSDRHQFRWQELFTTLAGIFARRTDGRCGHLNVHWKNRTEEPERRTNYDEIVLQTGCVRRRATAFVPRTDLVAASTGIGTKKNQTDNGNRHFAGRERK